jgi:hypothetical protein
MLRGKDGQRAGKQIRDIGTYTLIPTMMAVGPVLGYLLGRMAEKKWGHDPWLSLGGALFGLAAAGRQIYLILTRRGGPR